MPPTDAYRRFLTSKAIGFAEWHDGVGYDLEAFAAMLPVERDAVTRASRSSRSGTVRYTAPRIGSAPGGQPAGGVAGGRR